MIADTLLGIVQNIVMWAVFIDVILIIYFLLSFVLDLSRPNQAKKGVLISVGAFVAIFYLDSVIYSIFFVHILQFPIFLL